MHNFFLCLFASIPQGFVIMIKCVSHRYGHRSFVKLWLSNLFPAYQNLGSTIYLGGVGDKGKTKICVVNHYEIYSGISVLLCMQNCVENLNKYQPANALNLTTLTWVCIFMTM